MERISRAPAAKRKILGHDIVRDLVVFTMTLFGHTTIKETPTGPRLNGLATQGIAPLSHILLTVLMLASIALAMDGDSARELSLTKRVFCNCGCREVLGECSHAECEARTPLKREIVTAIQQGKSDDRILGDLGTKYGAAILVVPAFRGFDALLWIVPIAAALITLVAFIWRRWSVAKNPNR